MADLAALRAEAAGQDGQFAIGQARLRGFTRSSLANLRRTGEIATLRRNVARFTVAAGDPDPGITAYLACWPKGVISHASAAHHHGIGRTAPATPAHVTVPHGVACEISGVVVHRSRFLPASDVLRVGTVKYTTVARTVCDTADINDLWESLSRLDDAVAKGASRAWIHSRATALASGRAGVAAVAAATSPEASVEFRSWLERAAAEIYRACHIPDPEWNVLLVSNGVTLGKADALWRWYRVISEKEGLRFHTSPQQRRDDAKRFNRFLDAGYSPRRFTWRDVVDDPVEVAATVLRALNAAGANLDLARVPRKIMLPERPFLGRWSGFSTL